MDTGNDRTHDTGLTEDIYGPAPDPSAGESSSVIKVAPPTGPKRAGYTTNKGRPRNKVRARMAKTSRVRNRR